MTRLSVVLRPIYREALDLLAREQRTSISQALENVLAQALRARKVNDKPLLEIAQGMVWNSSDTLQSRIYRVRNQPFKTPDEQYAVEVLDILREELPPEKLIDVTSHDPYVRLLFDMIDESYKMGNPSTFCARMFIECIDFEDKGRGMIFNFVDSAGIEYVYNLEDYFGDE